MDEDLKLVERLEHRAKEHRALFGSAKDFHVMEEAAATITRLRATITQMTNTIDGLEFQRNDAWSEIETLKSDVSDLVRAGSDEATENERLVKERDTALFQAESIANYTAAFYGPPENWQPMTGDLNGLLSQISNAVTGLALASRAETAEAQRDAALEALSLLASIWHHGSFVAETRNERLLSDMLTHLGLWPVQNFAASRTLEGGEG